MTSIFTYFDFREFLKDDLAERKTRNPAFSIRSMAAKLNIDGSTLTRIFNEKRNISNNLLPRFIEVLGLRSKEAEYFVHLVQLSQARSERRRMEEYNNLVLLRSGRIKEIPSDMYEFYEKWYLPVIREVLRFFPFRGDYLGLSRMLEPAITVHEAKYAIKKLEQLGFIGWAGETCVVRDQHISTGDVWQGMAIQKFHRDTLMKALEGLERIPRDERDYATMTMCYSAEGYKKVRELLKRTREEMARIEECDRQCTCVYQINMQLFPLSKKHTGEEQ